MKKIAYIISSLCLLASCQQVQFIESNADRQGLTSISAIITSGQYENEVLATLYVEDDNVDEFVIPIPWYYPETSDDVTTFFMTSLRIRAELQPNFKLSPALGVLDLTEDNWFTYTKPNGESRRINIRGERRHSNVGQIVTMMIDEMMVSCIVDNDTRSILVPFMGDVTSCKLSFQVNPHSTLSKVNGKAYKASDRYDLSHDAKVTVKADDGTEYDYTVKQGLPEKVDMGINPASLSKLFNFNPVTRLGLPNNQTTAFISLASLESYLVINLGDGAAPMYINRFDGAKVGTVNLGSAIPDVITNDEAEHLLFANAALGGAVAEDVNVYVTSSVKTAPTLLCTFKNPCGEPIGHRMKVIGDVTKDAVIVFTAEGVEGVTTTNSAAVIYIKNGAMDGEAGLVQFPAFGWGPAPVNVATVIPASLNPKADGYFLDFYEGNCDENGTYLLQYIKASGANTVVGKHGNWAVNPNCLDIKYFNGVRYMTLFVVSHFPEWSCSPQIHFYEVYDPSSPTYLSGTEDMVEDMGEKGVSGVAAGDVIMAPTADGYRMYIYYYDHNSECVGGYVCDCIKR